VAHIWFLTIHPFADGNGRIARAIADMTRMILSLVPWLFVRLERELGIPSVRR
jgi:fido (protein-threonine AMPylation protein)